jgi:hypothetical protein
MRADNCVAELATHPLVFGYGVGGGLLPVDIWQRWQAMENAE